MVGRLGIGRSVYLTAIVFELPKDVWPPWISCYGRGLKGKARRIGRFLDCERIVASFQTGRVNVKVLYTGTWRENIPICGHCRWDIVGVLQNVGVEHALVVKEMIMS